jgi:2-octaprenylphenol hydroxylase
MEGFKQLFARDELPVRWLRNTGMRWFEKLAPLKKQIAARAMGVTD